MAHFAEINDDNVVTNVVVVDNSNMIGDNGTELEDVGHAFLSSLTGHSRWIQTSYNSNFRKNYAGVGYTYDSIRDAFISPKPFPSWVLNESTCRWGPPVPYPNSSEFHGWNESLQSWVAAQ